MVRLVTRRQVATALCGAVAFATTASRVARAAQFELKSANNLPLTHPASRRLLELWAAVEKESGGRCKVAFFPNSVLGGDASMLTQLRTGALDFFQVFPGAIEGLVPVSAILNLGFIFKSDEQAYHALDGPLGDYLRNEMAAKSLIAMKPIWNNGLREITSSTKPIRVPDDLRGFKIRVPESRVWVDLFKTLGASPTPLDMRDLYTAMQTKLVDGQEATLLTALNLKFYEVQKYLSLSNHMWSGTWLTANGDMWKALPPDIRGIIERNAMKFARLEWKDIQTDAASMVTKLQGTGMIVNTTDASVFRAQLGPYFQYWKNLYGPTAWGLLENGVGAKLG